MRKREGKKKRKGKEEKWKKDGGLTVVITLLSFKTWAMSLTPLAWMLFPPCKTKHSELSSEETCWQFLLK